jgi:hypothetical protein
MGSLALQFVELDVEQTTAGGLEDAELPAEVYDSPTAAVAEEDHVAGLQAECRLGGTCEERPRRS